MERAVTLAAAAFGLVGYLYALGGIVVWLRVQAAQLTPDSAIVATNDRHLLSIGARVVAFELFLLIAVGAIIATVVGVAIWRRGELPKRPPTKELRMLKQAWEDLGTLGGFVGPEAGLLAIAVGLSIDGSAYLRKGLWVAGAAIAAVSLLAMIFRVPPKGKEPHEYRPWRARLKTLGGLFGTKRLKALAMALLVIAVGTAIFLLPLLQGTILLAGTVLIYAGPFVNWPDRGEDSFGRQLLRSGGFWMAVTVLTTVALAWVATPPVDFTKARAESLDRTTSTSGGYLDRADGGVYLGVCTAEHGGSGQPPTSTDAHIQFVPAEESARLELGRETYEFDPGGRPSIWQAVESIFGGNSAAEKNAPLHHPLRGQTGRVCGT
jgi:hypothetical protein